MNRTLSISYEVSSKVSFKKRRPPSAIDKTKLSRSVNCPEFQTLLTTKSQEQLQQLH